MWLWSSASFCQRSANRGNCLHGRNVFGSMYDEKCRNYNIRSAPVTYKNFKISKKLWNISWMQIVYDKKQNKRELWANHFLLFCIYDSILIIILIITWLGEVYTNIKRNQIPYFTRTFSSIYLVSCTHQKIYQYCPWDVWLRKWWWWTGSNNYWREYTSWKASNALQLQKMQVRQNVCLSQKQFTMFWVL